MMTGLKALLAPALLLLALDAAAQPKLTPAAPAKPAVDAAKEIEETDVDEIDAFDNGSEKLWAVRCMELQESVDKKTLVFGLDRSRLSFHVKSSDPNFAAYKNILRDACANRQKKLDLRYDSRTQRIDMLRFSLRK